MKKIVLQEENLKEKFYPFTLTRDVADIRIGILSIREKWSRIAGGSSDAEALFMPSNHIPTNRWLDTIPSDEIRILHYPWQIFEFNDWALREDYILITQNKSSETISSTNRVIAPQNIFIEPGAKVEHCILNAENGPIYIGENAIVMEGSMIRGPVAICEGATIKMGTAIYGATTIGPYCIVGGEVKNSVLFGYSNKAHHGYLGDSVIGEWCNLGAGTSNSNMKNSAGSIKVWDMANQEYVNAGVKCGLLMGDFCRSAINTSFNTGTVMGVCANVFNSGELTEKYIPSFSWGGKGNVKYEFEKALAEIRTWMKLKNKTLSDEQVAVLRHIFELS
jgi:UDP-N-acetylglucosamine diphosphorylase/glucosamine-1-phosphate N-acetyltransferase